MQHVRRSLLVRYGVAVLSSAIALDLSLLFRSVLEPTVGQLFFPAVVVSAWYGGFGPGLVAAASSILALEYFFILPFSPVPDSSTLVRAAVFFGVALTISSLTARRRQSEAMRERLLHQLHELSLVAQRQAAELQSVLDNMVDGVLVCDAQGWMTLANEAGVRQLGLGGLEEAKRPLEELLPRLRIRDLAGRPVSAKELPLVRALAGEVVTQEDEIIHNPRLEQDRYLRISAAPIRNEAGTIVGAVAVARDVTELTELDRLKDQFIQVAAHELKTPVTVMKGYTQVLLRSDHSTPTPTQRRQMLQAIERGTSRISRTVNDLLEVSRLQQRGSLDLTMERIQLPELVAQVVEGTALTAPRHRLRVVCAAPVQVQGDRDRLEQVLNSLLDNAIRYSPEGGEVVVEVAAQDRRAVVSVKDSGVGIPHEKQGRIFQRFYRAHAGMPYDFGGMGVGLFIAKQIVARHGGELWFESREGQGSTFSFSLPIV